MKAGLFATTVLGAVMMSSLGHAADWTVSSGYIFEKQAFAASDTPVANVSIDTAPLLGITPNIWFQVGEDALSNELDLTGTISRDLGGMQASITAGGYFYPFGGSKPIYTAALNVAVPMGPVTLGAGIQRYEGALVSTQSNVEVSGSIRGFDLTVGKAYNDPEELAPWYLRLAHPLWRSKNAPTVAIRGFWGEGTKFVVDVSGTF